MVEKFMGQGTSKEALLEEKATAEKKLADVLKAKNDSLLKFNTMKAQVAQTGIGGLELNREIYDKVNLILSFDFLKFKSILSVLTQHNYFLLFCSFFITQLHTHIHTHTHNISQLDEEILGAKAELKLNRATCDRLEKSLVAVRQGAKGLSQRMGKFFFF